MTNDYAGASSGKVGIIYDTLKERIISTYYAPGEVLNEQAIADEFGVSRTPVREALRRLQQDNWLTVLPKIGMQVETLDIKHFRDLFSTKEVLETLAIQQAGDNATKADIELLRGYLAELSMAGEEDFDEFVRIDHLIHSKIWEVANNQVLMIYLPDLQNRLLRAWKHTGGQGVGTDKAMLLETFTKIVDSIETHDKNMAAEVEHEHIEYHRNEMRKGLF